MKNVTNQYEMVLTLLKSLRFFSPKTSEIKMQKLTSFLQSVTFQTQRIHNIIEGSNQLLSSKYRSIACLYHTFV